VTNYFIRKTGNDGNAGTSAGAAWLTLSKALGAAGIASGDTVYIGAGTYRETVTVAMTTAVAETRIIGDVNGINTGDAGEVIWTAYTTNDTTAPAATALLTLAGRDFLTFEDTTFVGGNTDPSVIDAYTAHSRSITFRRCVMLPGTAAGPLIGFVSTANEASTWVIEQCSFLQSYSYAMLFSLTTSASADYDSNIQIRNCVVYGGGDQFLHVLGGGGNSFKGGGVDIINCTILCGEILRVSNANISTSIPCTVYNSICVNGTANALVANTSGQIIENYNILVAPTPRSNVTAGANSIANLSRATIMDIGQSWLVARRNPRVIGTPSTSSPLLAYGDKAVAPSTDFHAKTRPNPPSVGAFEDNPMALRTRLGGVQ
jgi:hypothetical protein